MKTSVHDLAIWGGVPAFKEKLHVGRPNIGDRKHLLRQINNILDRRWFSNNGEVVQELERRLAERAGVKHCVATCNATIALEIAARALALKGEVIMPSFTFVSTPNSLQWLQITPVFCDIDPKTHNLDPRRVEELITPSTTAIVGVHVWGRPCAVDELESIARRCRLALLFDAAHAFGCSHQGRMVGGFGDAEVFSFHATKFLNTFEGGAVATNNDELAATIKLMRNHGFAGPDNVVCVGTNGKMTEVCAAMGLSSLECIDEFINANRSNYHLFEKELFGLDGVSLIAYDPAERNNYQYIVLEIDEKITGIGRDDLLEVLNRENVLARRYFYPGCHRMGPYKTAFAGTRGSLPETEKLADRILTLPTGVVVQDKDIAIICRVIRTAVAHGPKVVKRLHETAGG